MARSESLGNTIIPVPFSAVVAAAMTESVTPPGRDWICSVNWNWNRATLPSAETSTPGMAPSTTSGPYGGASPAGVGSPAVGASPPGAAPRRRRSRPEPGCYPPQGRSRRVDDVVQGIHALDGRVDSGHPLRGPKGLAIRGYEDDASLTPGSLGQLLGQLVQHPLRIGALDPHLRSDADAVGGQQDQHDPRATSQPTMKYQGLLYAVRPILYRNLDILESLSLSGVSQVAVADWNFG